MSVGVDVAVSVGVAVGPSVGVNVGVSVGVALGTTFRMQLLGPGSARSKGNFATGMQANPS